MSTSSRSGSHRGRASTATPSPKKRQLLSDIQGFQSPEGKPRVEQITSESPSRLAAKYKNWTPHHLSAHIKSSLSFGLHGDPIFESHSVNKAAAWVVEERLSGRAFFDLAEEDVEELQIPEDRRKVLLHTWRDLHHYSHQKDGASRNVRSSARPSAVSARSLPWQAPSASKQGEDDPVTQSIRDKASEVSKVSNTVHHEEEAHIMMTPPASPFTYKTDKLLSPGVDDDDEQVVDDMLPTSSEASFSSSILDGSLVDTSLDDPEGLEGLPAPGLDLDLGQPRPLQESQESFYSLPNSSANDSDASVYTLAHSYLPSESTTSLPESITSTTELGSPEPTTRTIDTEDTNDDDLTVKLNIPLENITREHGDFTVSVTAGFGSKTKPGGHSADTTERNGTPLETHPANETLNHEQGGLITSDTADSESKTIAETSLLHDDEHLSNERMQGLEHLLSISATTIVELQKRIGDLEDQLQVRQELDDATRYFKEPPQKGDVGKDYNDYNSLPYLGLVGLAIVFGAVQCTRYQGWIR